MTLTVNRRKCGLIRSITMITARGVVFGQLLKQDQYVTREQILHFLEQMSGCLFLSGDRETLKWGPVFTNHIVSLWWMRSVTDGVSRR